MARPATFSSLAQLIIRLAAAIPCAALVYPASAPAASTPALAYETSAYELAPHLQPEQRPWNRRALKQEILARVAREKQRQEVDVYYYRIGYTMSFPLPLTRRPELTDLPSPLPGRVYPWLIWLTWELDDRWRLFHAAWRQFGDREAGRLLQRELAALAGWDHLCEIDGNVGLVTGHLAGCLSLALADLAGWDPQLLQQTRSAADALLERDVWPWFERQWREENLTPAQLANIPVIALVRSAQLARVLKSPRQTALEEKSLAVLRAWSRFRMNELHHTEGTAYDGFLMDNLTEWLSALPERAQILRENHEAFRSLADQWMDLTLPGRFDLEAPLGDVEAEMTFWATALARTAQWYGWQDASWFLHRFPLQRFRAPAVIFAYQQKLPAPSAAPAAGLQEHPYSLSLRTGWQKSDALAVVGLSRCQMGHLQPDGGQLILGWQGRFWITDPGYQQYRPGEERNYTLGLQAHNAPVIGGKMQTARAARPLLLETNASGTLHARVDLTACYQGLPAGAAVQREVWMLPKGGLAVVARDTFRGLKSGTEISTSWQGGDHLAWAFRDGWTRLSDGQHAVWITTVPGQLEAATLTRHPGSRGPLTLSHTARLPTSESSRWWVFWCDPNCGWEAPTLETAQDGLRVTSPGAKAITWLVR